MNISVHDIHGVSVCAVYACVLIYCSDMSKPINVLTGIDYWLDNLMCNVPELAMCYHDNGIVQVSFYVIYCQFVVVWFVKTVL